MKKRPAASRWFTSPVWWTGTSHSSKGTYGLLVHFVEQNLWWQSIKCAVFDKLDILNHIYIFCACALPKKDSHMDDKTPLRHIYIIQHISPYNCHLATTCRNTSTHKWIYYKWWCQSLWNWKQSIYCSWVWSLLFSVVTCAISGSVIGYPVW